MFIHSRTVDGFQIGKGSPIHKPIKASALAKEQNPFANLRYGMQHVDSSTIPLARFLSDAMRQSVSRFEK
jgi:hypothetical protein